MPKLDIGPTFSNNVKEKKEQPICAVEYEWDFIASFTVDARHPADFEILDTNIVSLQGGLDSEGYFSEAVYNADLRELFAIGSTSKFNPAKHPGIYRLVFGVTCRSDVSHTDCGDEYDAWEEYDRISLYKYTKEEEPYCIPGDDELPEMELDELWMTNKLSGAPKR